MPNTTNFNWPTPADTDLVKDGAAAIRNLGNGVDTSLVDLKGGTTGQILSKASNADMDFTFITPNVGDITEVQAGTGISVASGTGPIPVVTNSMATEITAKGDLIVGTGSGTFDNLPAGTNGHILVADSSVSPTGLKWAAPAAAGFVGCLINKSAVQSIANDSEAIVSYDQETFDTDGFHSNVTNNTRITIPSGKGGYYLFYGNYNFAANSTGVRMAYFIKNGAGGAIQGSQNLLGATPSNVYMTNNAILVNLTAGDYLEMAVQQTSGGSLNLNTNHTVFGCTYLGA